MWRLTDRQTFFLIVERGTNSSTSNTPGLKRVLPDRSLGGHAQLRDSSRARGHHVGGLQEPGVLGRAASRWAPAQCL